MHYLADGFRGIDGEAEVEKFAACLTCLDCLPSFSLYKSYVRDVILQSGGQSLDVGCGIGFDVLRVAQCLPAYTAFGVDLSQRFVEEAEKKARALDVANASFLRMNACALDFPDEMFASTRVDRSLQHVADPAKVVGEMVRVTKPVGTIVLAEPDWGSFFLGDRSVLTAKVSGYFATKFRHPNVGRCVATLLEAAGANVTDLRGYALIARGAAEADRVFDVERTCELLDREENVKRYGDWWRVFRSRTDVVSSVTIYIAVGQKRST